jgi:hypothetical protein
VLPRDIRREDWQLRYPRPPGNLNRPVHLQSERIRQFVDQPPGGILCDSPYTGWLRGIDQVHPVPLLRLRVTGPVGPHSHQCPHLVGITSSWYLRRNRIIRQP